jgi:starch-binding outer membrane protein, SusD/RagB family
MKLYKILISSVLFLSFISCKKVIDIKETDLIAGDLALKTVSSNEQGLIGAYGRLSIDMDILLNSTFSDEVKKGEFYNAATTHEWQYSSTDITIRDNFTATTDLYVIIDRVNRVIRALPKADSTKSGDEALRKKVKGEAMFIRAFCHFELFRYYCGNYDPNGLAMPYLQTPSVDPTTPYARINMGPYFDKLKADLDTAKGLVPDNLTDINRATKLAVSGLQARVALYMKNWPGAITYSTEYINGIPLSPRATFAGLWSDANNNELAFKLKKSTGNRLGSLFRGTSTTSGGKTLIGTITWLPSDKLWNSYDQTNDVRFGAYLKDEPILTAASRASKIISKYAGTAYTTSGENIADAKIFRTGEMYLIRAEARAESGIFTGPNSAESDINDLRTARISNYVNVTFASKTEAIDAIMLERFKELPFEGHRFWDLKRRGLPVARLASDAPTAAATTLPANNFRFLLPIPDAEMKANKLMTQNPGYSN